ncbi:hypothetical protein [Mucilaginibacter phyllosphaerae]|uniref:Uncharacterized protein n=1 Tax=Mucilaginibacter phyllosphaerae TaxID=1812349 RepID=A0A4Y8A7F1_9SPHI|nr:hypothetical protein [Mucilaginibacter phyllosphaerae]MBB3970757.1 hypothetical protein [Mucilaginibacter phyllosphaerae]TEW64299.1 hypothetical protein E2R65_18310 [Mucilaginibacter phyllosphaerae]GGH04427.1 hypothetical protein GCM10007352_07610 [Mucilaginibacter phyllosphaerae]
MAEYNDNDQQNKPQGYRVDDDSNLEEKDLRKTTFMFGSEEKSGEEPGMESNGAGGHRFGENSNTPSGDDKNNPSQNAGYGNDYFKRTEPSEEHPEHNNFKDPNQLGQPNYTQATGAAPTGQSDEENEGPKQEEADENKHQQSETYQEGTADNDGATTGTNSEGDVAGYGELPDQQKVGE